MPKRFLRPLTTMSTGLIPVLLVWLVFGARPALAQCQAPIIGDWLITRDCTLQENQAAPEDVIVQNGAQLTIPPGVTLGVGFDSYSLRVQNESRVSVQNGGRIATYRCPQVEPELLNARFRFQYDLTANSLTDGFYNESTGLAGQGYRPQRLTGYRRGDMTRFATNWLQVGGTQRPSEFDLTGTDFDTRSQILRSQGYRLIDVSGYNPPGDVRFADIWVENNDGLDWDVFRGDTLELLQQRAPQGLIPVRVEAYEDGGTTRFISLWVESECTWRMELALSAELFQTHFNDYGDTFRLVHMDQYTVDGRVYYAAIWWQHPPADPQQTVRSSYDWYLFQRFLNNNWCNGFVLANFYAADHPNGVDGVRYGGIWTFDEPLNVTQTSPLSLKVQQEINCTDGNNDGALDGRGGVAIVRINANTGAIEDEIYHHANQVFGSSSTIKIAIAFTVLRLLDQDPNSNVSLNTQINVGGQYGLNQGNRLSAGQAYPVSFLIQTMIADSNNWATDRLIDCIGSGFSLAPAPSPNPGQVCLVAQNSITAANQAMQQDLAPLGLSNTQLRRYMVGGPNWSTDYQNGLDVTTTPREITTLLRFLHDGIGPSGNQLLSATNNNFLWNTLMLDPDDLTGLIGGPPGTGFNGKGNIEDLLSTGVNTNFPTPYLLPIFNKIGSNSWGAWDSLGNPTTALGTFVHKPQISSHLQQSEAGRLNLDNNGDGIPDSFIFYGIYIDEADGPRSNAGSNPTANPLQRIFSCIGAQVVREYSVQTIGNLVTGTTPPCQSP